MNQINEAHKRRFLTSMIPLKREKGEKNKLLKLIMRSKFNQQACMADSIYSLSVIFVSMKKNIKTHHCELLSWKYTNT